MSSTTEQPASAGEATVRERLADLAAVCDAYGLPHDAVALARHLASNAEHDHNVNMDTIHVLAPRLAAVWDEAVEAVAWAQENGPLEGALRYVADHNPYRATPHPTPCGPA